jgi:hypothetical protein
VGKVAMSWTAKDLWEKWLRAGQIKICGRSGYELDSQRFVGKVTTSWTAKELSFDFRQQEEMFVFSKT